MRPSLLAFVQAFIQSGASDRLESAMQFYAPKVDYYDKGDGRRRFYPEGYL